MPSTLTTMTRKSMSYLPYRSGRYHWDQNAWFCLWLDAEPARRRLYQGYSAIHRLQVRVTSLKHMQVDAQTAIQVLKVDGGAAL